MGQEEQSADDRRLRALAEAEAMLRSANVEFMDALSFQSIADGLGKRRSQIDHYFDQASLRQAIIESCLTPERAQGEWFAELMADTFVQVRAGTDLETVVRRTAGIHEFATAHDRGVISQIALWSLATTDTQVAQRISDLYAWYEDGGRPFVSEVFESCAVDGRRPLDGLDPSDFLVVFTAISEGLCVRRSVDPDAVPPGITGTASVALVEGCVSRRRPGALLGSVRAAVGSGVTTPDRLELLQRPGRHEPPLFDVDIANTAVASADLRSQIVEWCVVRLQSANLEWLKAVPAAEIGRRIGRHRSTVLRWFDGADGLRSAIVRHVLREPNGHEELSMIERPELADPTTTLDDKLAGLIEDHTWTLGGGDRIVSRMALWSAGHEERDVKVALRASYARRTRDLVAVLDGIVGAAADAGLGRRSGLTLMDVATLWIAIDDGLAIRRRIDPDLVRPDLVVDAQRILIEALLRDDDDDGRVGGFLSTVRSKRLAE